MQPGDGWHGFEDIAPDWCMLDPIKVSILTPGMGDDGKLQDTRSSRGARQRVLHALRDRPDASHGLPGHVPVLDRHHQGEVGHADHQPALVQAPLRRQRSGRRRAAGAGRAAPGAVSQRRAARPRRRDVRLPEEVQPRRAPEPRLRDAARARDDAAGGVSADRVERRRDGAGGRRSRTASPRTRSCPTRRAFPC